VEPDHTQPAGAVTVAEPFPPENENTPPAVLSEKVQGTAATKEGTASRTMTRHPFRIRMSPREPIFAGPPRPLLVGGIVLAEVSGAREGLNPWVNVVRCLGARPYPFWSIDYLFG
jgi:hypothetical protein